MDVKRRSASERILEALFSRPRSVQQLLELTNLPERTLRYHLANLRKQNIIRETFLLSDRRRKLISLSKKFKKLKISSRDSVQVRRGLCPECSAW